MNSLLQRLISWLETKQTILTKCTVGSPDLCLSWLDIFYLFNVRFYSWNESLFSVYFFANRFMFRDIISFCICECIFTDRPTLIHIVLLVSIWHVLHTNISFDLINLRNKILYRPTHVAIIKNQWTGRFNTC